MADCDRCEAAMPTDTAYICPACAAMLTAVLRSAVSLLGELDIVITRQAVTGHGTGRTSREQRLALDLDASYVADTIVNTFGTWARAVSEERGISIPGPDTTWPVRTDLHGPRCRAVEPQPGLPDWRTPGSCSHDSCRELEAHRRRDVQATPDTALAAAVRWLAEQVEWLRHHPIAAEAIDELTYSCWLLRVTVDRSADRVYLGQCLAQLDDGACDEDVFAVDSAATVACKGCGTRWDVQQRRAWLLEEARDVLASAVEIARALSGLGTPVARGSITAWGSRGMLAQHPPLPGTTAIRYRVGDVLDYLERTPRRTRRTVAAA